MNLLTKEQQETFRMDGCVIAGCSDQSLHAVYIGVAFLQFLYGAYFAIPRERG